MVTGKDGSVEKFRVTMLEEPRRYVITNATQPFATVAITWNPADREDSDHYLAEQQWLFKKLTGLPREAFPEQPDEKKIEPLEKHSTVLVSGNDEAKKRLSEEK